MDSVSYGDQSGKLKEARKSNPYLAKTNFSSTQATLRRLDNAFKAFFRRVKAGETPGYPRFRGQDRFKTVVFPSYGDGCRLKENGRLYLQHVGHVKVKLHRPAERNIKTVSVKRSCGRWYASLSCELGDAPEATGEGESVGIVPSPPPRPLRRQRRGLLRRRSSPGGRRG
jgi:putative transposase